MDNAALNGAAGPIPVEEPTWTVEPNHRTACQRRNAAPPILRPYWSIAGTELRRHLDDAIRKRSSDGMLPWERPVAVGQIDFFKVHAYTLDRLGEILQCVLRERDATYDDTYWRGRHDSRSNWVIVSLLSGAWSDPAADTRGHDLVGLIAHLYQMPQRQAAMRLGAMLGIEAIRHE